MLSFFLSLSYTHIFFFFMLNLLKFHRLEWHKKEEKQEREARREEERVVKEEEEGREP